ncbi:MAG: hypothetical protein FD123_4181 [Bacteroidetes bacterium]|nr:MAG: hypothetical protein FD123_4181 [Bacteroidota bacterium]
MVNLKTAKIIVRVASLYNASALFVFLIPGGLALFGVKEPYSVFWQVLPALLASYAAIVLFFSSNNLGRFGSFPYWNGIIRVIFAVTALLLDFKTSVGMFIGLLAIGDLLIGVLCIYILPKATGNTHLQLLTNSLNNQ